MVMEAPAAGGDMMNSQAFWNDFMRRPEVRAAYQSDLKLQQKKMAWRAERDQLEEFATQRQQIGDILEKAPADLKKLISPMFHIRCVQQWLWSIYDECQKMDVDFVTKLKEPDIMLQLTRLRSNFDQGGEERMEQLSGQWHSICNQIVHEQEEQKKSEPKTADVHTLKHILEYGQECKRLGNEKFREGAYEEAFNIYSQGDEMMKQWTVQKHLNQEGEWLKGYHLACLKNKAQCALKLDRFQAALDAADAALKLEASDHKALYRKALAEKSLGYFDEAEDTLLQLEEVAESLPDRRQILKDCEAERKRLLYARIKHEKGTKEMLGKAFESGVFANDRVAELEQPQGLIEQEKALLDAQSRPRAPVKPLERNIHLTQGRAGDLLDELIEAYGEHAFQQRVRKCAYDSGYDKRLFLNRLKDLAFASQKPVLQRWGFDPDEAGVREMQAAVREHTTAKDAPEWLKEKQQKCLERLYGGPEGGMVQQLLL
mmetsp:Transcript_31276/g.72946  ORF Transcript_31276/g.72946 Transcript_31276/m.72946 type:complete len:486 (-) Transcript_31276:52-1509(-)